MNNLCIHPNYLYLLAKQCNLQEIGRLCQTSTKIYLLIKSDQLFKNLIERKNQEFIKKKTDLFLCECIRNLNPLYEAAQIGDDVEIIDELIRRGYDSSFDLGQIINTASLFGNFNIVNHFIKDEKFDPSYKNNSAILNASIRGFFNIVNRLLEDPRVNPADRNNISIEIAYEHHHWNIVKRLLADSRVWTSLSDNDRQKYSLSVVDQ